MRFLITSIILLTTLFLTGCGSIITRSTHYDNYYVYPGVRESVKELNYQCGAGGVAAMGCIGNGLVKPFIIIDLPFTFVVDTVLLPVDGIIYGVSSATEEPEPR
ncbi:YceK/YidQ family lipoprotein [Leminorella grimontii]|uniref:YceK/YidQ family lipoprotein n=1 Tax=Leminorella grimontii TaxID=82981 RepID=UPI00322050FA